MKKLSVSERACAALAVMAFSAHRPRLASQLSPACPVLPAAQYIDKEFPSETADLARAAPDAVPEISICRNRQRTFQRRASGCHRRGNALRPSAPKRRNIGPWLSSSFEGRIVRSNGIKVLGAFRRPSFLPVFSRFFDDRGASAQTCAAAYRNQVTRFIGG